MLYYVVSVKHVLIKANFIRDKYFQDSHGLLLQLVLFRLNQSALALLLKILLIKNINNKIIIWDCKSNHRSSMILKK